MGLFGPSVKEIWAQLAEEINGNYIEGSMFKPPRIEYKHKNWTLYLDLHKVSRGKSYVVYTRIRAPFINMSDFSFKLYRKGPFSNMGKSLGMQNIEIGYEVYDNEFITKSNNESLIKALLYNSSLRQLILQQSKLTIEIKEHEGMFGPKFADKENELSLEVYGKLKDIDVLKSLFELFTKLLDELEANNITLDQGTDVSLYHD